MTQNLSSIIVIFVRLCDKNTEQQAIVGPFALLMMITNVRNLCNAI
jgi:hypothetical protein